MVNTINSTDGAVIWITGLAGSGKTTVANMLCHNIIEEYNIKPIILDGNTLRNVFSGKFNFSSEDRKFLAGVYSKMSCEFSRQGHICVCSTISMFNSIRYWNRQNINNYIEIFLDVNIAELETRKPIVYKNKQNVVGRDIKYEKPINPDLIIPNYGNNTAAKSARLILKYILKCNKYILC